MCGEVERNDLGLGRYLFSLIAARCRFTKVHVN